MPGGMKGGEAAGRLLHGAGCRGLRGSELLLSTSINPGGERGCRGGKRENGGEGVLLPRSAPRKPPAGAEGTTRCPRMHRTTRASLTALSFAGESRLESQAVFIKKKPKYCLKS